MAPLCEISRCGLVRRGLRQARCITIGHFRKRLKRHFRKAWSHEKNSIWKMRRVDAFCISDWTPKGLLLDMRFYLLLSPFQSIQCGIFFNVASKRNASKTDTWPGYFSTSRRWKKERKILFYVTSEILFYREKKKSYQTFQKHLCFFFIHSCFNF